MRLIPKLKHMTKLNKHITIINCLKWACFSYLLTSLMVFVSVMLIMWMHSTPYARIIYDVIDGNVRSYEDFIVKLLGLFCWLQISIFAAIGFLLFLTFSGIIFWKKKYILPLAFFTVLCCTLLSYYTYLRCENWKINAQQELEQRFEAYHE